MDMELTILAHAAMDFDAIAPLRQLTRLAKAGTLATMLLCAITDAHTPVAGPAHDATAPHNATILIGIPPGEH